ncbi:MAG: 7,8-dihydroneopterin aldolase/epimerase/oxygenase [Thermoplasmata archaeon]|jgi:dihydroneopterin aldolase|nr:7,8-dihydroneopterin aldolase/epimerase/oxygenase [Thermoplasmata archaeon]
MDRVSLRNVRVFTHVGCTHEERHVGQHLEIDFDAYLDLAGAQDRIGATLDYAAAYRAIRAAVEGHEANLVETIAERAAQAVLGLGAKRVTIRVRKPAPPIPGAHADWAEVEITRDRNE